jgi:hypothetical protein
MQRIGRVRYRGGMAATRTIDIRTELPGPRSRAILERKAKVIADPLSIYLPIVIEEASGAVARSGGGGRSR